MSGERFHLSSAHRSASRTQERVEAMAYIDRDTDVKSYLGISGTAEDSMLDLLIVAAQAGIDAYCDRTFAAGSDTARTFEAQRETDGAFLLLGTDLAQVTSVTNGDAAATLLHPADYLLVPRVPPHLALLLRTSAGVAWEGEIVVVGRWAYSISPPPAIVQAMREYVGHLYRAYDEQGGGGNLALRRLDRALPAHLKQALEPYRRLP